MRINKKHLIVRSRNTTCAPLREIMVPKTTILRLGSTTPTERITKDSNPVEINTAEACYISGNKILMRKVFLEHDIPIAEGICTKNQDELLEFVRKYKNMDCNGFDRSISF